MFTKINKNILINYFNNIFRIKLNDNFLSNLTKKNCKIYLSSYKQINNFGKEHFIIFLNFSNKKES